MASLPCFCVPSAGIVALASVISTQGLGHNLDRISMGPRFNDWLRILMKQTIVLLCCRVRAASTVNHRVGIINFVI